MRRGTEHNQLARPVRCNLLEQFVALLLFLRSLVSGSGSRVNLIHDHQVWAVFKKLRFPTIALSKVDTDNEMTIVLVWTCASPRNHSFQTRDGTRAHDFRMNMELIAQLLLPLITQMGRTQHAKATSITAGKQ